jgi:hypothetical protein
MRAALIFALVLVVLGCSVEATDNPPAAQVQESDGSRVAGKVLETLDAASYTYVRLATANGEAWAAVPRARLEIGSEVAIVNPQAMANFESKTLERTFDTIYFGTLENPQASSPMAMGGANPHGNKPDQGAQAAPIEVAKAEGASGRTVAELYAERDDLAGKTVALRGKVVKYNAGIMGRNWLHLQDGTGDAAAGNHDITVTSSDTTAVGEIVLVQGTVSVDKDFGSGYRYEIIVEDASVK